MSYECPACSSTMRVSRTFNNERLRECNNENCNEVVLTIEIESGLSQSELDLKISQSKKEVKRIKDKNRKSKWYQKKVKEEYASQKSLKGIKNCEKSTKVRKSAIIAGSVSLLDVLKSQTV